MSISSSPEGFSETQARGRMTAWVTSGSTSPVLGTRMAGSYVARVHVHVTEAFNSSGSDTLTVGYDADTDAIVTSVDVSTTGVKSVTLGVDAGYSGTARQLEGYYLAGGTAPTTGKAIIIIEIFPCPKQP